MKWLDNIIGKYIAKRIRKEIEMNGWKTKAAGIGAICGGIAVLIHGLSGDKFNFDEIKEGGAGIIAGMGMLGLGHKIDKNTAAVNSTKTVPLIILTMLLLSGSAALAQTKTDVWIGASVDAAAQTNAAGHLAYSITNDDLNYFISTLTARGGTEGFSKPVYDAEQYYGRKLLQQGRFTVLALGGGGVSNGEATTGIFEGGFAIETGIWKGWKVAFLAKGAFSPGIENNAAPRLGIVFGRSQ